MVILQHDIVWEDSAATRTHLEPMVANAVAAGANFVVLPEMFATGFSANTQAISEPFDGPTARWLKAMAKQHQIHIVGSICEEPNRSEPADSGLPGNIAVLAGPDGINHRYAKKHLFTYVGENERIAPGSDLLTVDIGGVRVSVLICYDLRFGDDFWALAAETDAYVVIGNWPQARISHWRSLLISRAIENQAWVIGANRIGSGGKLDYSGDSLIVDPMGEVCADGAGGAQMALSCEVDATEVQRVRDRYPFLLDR